ncbi:right-handed parallel beta-helix repeat-containing protein [Alteribacter populi]|uniref:hyaluronate lyase N-terminal domain-containing protein n=1 Tax=Alteribacter populi TaxID=2011011 RepID=UPI000BBA441C|nr:right-handed parallel beta-helix repeat-containing protein [Alteribacter populi]
MVNKIQIKKSLKADLKTLDVGEFCFCTDTGELFIGSDHGNIEISKKEEIGQLSDLTTTDKTNIVTAINELKENSIHKAASTITHNHSTADILDLDTTVKYHDDIFSYDETSGKFVSKALSAIGSNRLDNLSDVDTNTQQPVDGNTLKYEDGKWQPRLLSDSISGIYFVELERWGIKNNKTDPIATVNGLNNAFIWAYESGYSHVILPKGEYLISHTQSIIPQSNTYYDFNGSKVYMEPNDKESYSIMRIGSTDSTKKTHHITITNGEFIGDRYEHDFSSGGTHEWGHCITLKGHCKFIKINNCIIRDAIGDGLFSEYNYDVWLYPKESDFELGGISKADGLKIDSTTTIRSKTPFNVAHFRVTNNDGKFMLTGNGYGSLPGINTEMFDIYFYNNNNEFISVAENKTWYQEVDRPLNAETMHFVLKQNTISNIAFEVRAEPRPEFVYLENCEVMYNRRVGIAASGTRFFYILNNSIHHNTGYVGGAIDIEDGYRTNQNFYIIGNKCYGHGINDVIIIGAYYITVSNNSFESNFGGSGKFWTVNSNSFKQSGGSITASDVIFINNHSHDSRFLFGDTNRGKNILITGCVFTNSSVVLNQSEPFAISIIGCSFYNDINKYKSGSLSSRNNIAKIQNVIISGRENSGHTILATDGSVIEDSTFINPTLNGSFWNIYKNCIFDSPAALTTVNAAERKLTFKECNFTVSSRFITFNSPLSILELNNCNIDVLSNSVDFISITAAARVNITHCTFNAESATSGAFFNSSGLNMAYTIFKDNLFKGTSTNVRPVRFDWKLTVEPTVYDNNQIEGIGSIPYIIGDTYELGSSTLRPQKKLKEGMNYFDTTLGKPIFVKSTGSTSLFTNEPSVRNKAYRLGYLVLENGKIHECTTAGTTNNIKPNFSTTLDETTVDGSVTWTCKGDSAVWVDASGNVV